MKTRKISLEKKEGKSIKKEWWNRFLEKLAWANKESLRSGCQH
jgi:hypothetical protein